MELTDACVTDLRSAKAVLRYKMSKKKHGYLTVTVSQDIFKKIAYELDKEVSTKKMMAWPLIIDQHFAFLLDGREVGVKSE